MFAKQFFGRLTATAFAAFFAVHVLAVLVLHHDLASLIALAVIGVVTAAVAWKSLSDGLLVAFAEIMVGGHGHLIAAPLAGFTLSLRMVIFVAVMGVFFVRVVQRKAWPKFQVFRDTPFLLLGLAIAIGTVAGFVWNDAGKAFDDMNSYLTVAYILPLLSVQWDSLRKRQLLEVLAASAAWVALQTLFVLFLFTHLPGKVLHFVYQCVRDTRLAEVTLLTGPTWFVHLLPTGWYFRVFEPAQFFTIVVILVLLAARFTLWRGERMPTLAKALLTVCVAAFVAGWSRSFILGTAVGGFVTFAAAVFDHIRAKGSFLVRSVQFLGVAALGVVLFWLTIVFPYPAHPDLHDAAFYEESTANDRDLAVSSRWNLLYPMFEKIMEHPVIGNGFGAEVTFVSDDLRVRAINPSGEWTTYRFEWGYQDIWLKMGLLGLMAFVWYFVVLSQAFWTTYRRHGQKWIVIGLYGGIVTLFVTHVFSPYLNHPIGLGYMLFVLPFFDWDSLDPQTQKTEEKKTAPVAAVAPSVVTRDVL